MGLLAVTVIGHDRPGIIADTTRLLADLGGNLEDSTMTILRGHFAMTLIVSAAAAQEQVEEALRPLTADGSLVVTVRPVADEHERPGGAPGAAQLAYVLRAHGADRPGIVSALTSVLAGAGGNITDLTTRLAGQFYLLIAEVDLPAGADVLAVTAEVEAVATGLGVAASLRPAEADVL